MKESQHLVCLLLGSNIKPEENLSLAIGLLHKSLTLVQTSSAWESQAIGSEGPNFLNAAVLALSPLDARNLKNQVFRPLEKQLGRIRTKDKNSPRTIDIDIILFDQQLLDGNLWQYAHIAVPVSEILPDYRSDDGALLKDFAFRSALITPIWARTDISDYPLATVFQNQKEGGNEYGYKHLQQKPDRLW